MSPSLPVRVLQRYIAMEDEGDGVYKILCSCGEDFGNDGHFILSTTIEALCDRCFRSREAGSVHELTLWEALSLAGVAHHHEAVH